MDQTHILLPPEDTKSFPSPAGGRNSCFYSHIPSPSGWAYCVNSYSDQSIYHEAEAGSHCNNPASTPKNPDLQDSAASNKFLFIPGPCQRSVPPKDRATAVRGCRQWSCPKCPQESHSLLVASLPCKQRPGDVKTRRWIFICCHGITFCCKRDSGTQSSLKTGKTTQWIYQMSRAWSLSPRPVFSVLLCHPSTRAKPPTSQQLDNSHVSCHLTTYTKVNTHKKVLERKDHSAAQSRDAEGNCHCYERMTMRMKN